MNQLATAILTVTLMTGVSGIALAATDTATPAAQPAAAAPTATAAPAAPAATAAKPAAAMPMHRTAMARHYRRDTSGDRDTKALNLLEANGYAQIEQFRADGKHFDATVKQAGKDVQVTVDPDTGQIQRQV